MVECSHKGKITYHKLIYCRDCGLVFGTITKNNLEPKLNSIFVKESIKSILRLNKLKIPIEG